MTVRIWRKRVFLDTEVFVREGFNFASRRLEEVRRLAEEHAIQVLTTSVTIKETKRRIEKMIRGARNALKEKDLRFTLGILRQTSVDCSFLKPLNVGTLVAEVENKYEEFLSACGTTICDTSKVSAEMILDAYFAGAPPFGPNQKKDQFPDAVAIAGLKEWQAVDKNEVYVVSNDPDLAGACVSEPGLVHVENVAKFLNLYNEGATEQAALVRAAITARREEIVQMVTEQFSDRGFILLDEDGDVEDVAVDSVELKEPLIVAIHDDYAAAEVDTEITFSALATYDDSSTGSYDSEDGIMVGMDRVTRSIQRTETLPIEVELEWHEQELLEVRISMPTRDIEVHLEDSDELYDRGSYV